MPESYYSYGVVFVAFAMLAVSVSIANLYMNKDTRQRASRTMLLVMIFFAVSGICLLHMQGELRSSHDQLKFYFAVGLFLLGLLILAVQPFVRSLGLRLFKPKARPWDPLVHPSAR